MTDSPEEFLEKNGLLCERLKMRLTARSCYQLCHREEPHPKCQSCLYPLYTTVPDFVPPVPEKRRSRWGFGTPKFEPKEKSSVVQDDREKEDDSTRIPAPDSIEGEHLREEGMQEDTTGDSSSPSDEGKGTDDSDELLSDSRSEDQESLDDSFTIPSYPKIIYRPDPPKQEVNSEERRRYTASEFARLCGVTFQTLLKAKNTIEKGWIFDSHGKTAKVVQKLEEMGLSFNDLFYSSDTIRSCDIVPRPQEKMYSVKEIGEMAGVCTRDVWNAISRFFQNGSTSSNSKVYKVFKIFLEKGITPEHISVRRRNFRSDPSAPVPCSAEKETVPICSSVSEESHISVPDAEQYKDAPVSPGVGLILSKIPLEGLLWEIRRRVQQGSAHD